ncbi:MiAMP1 family antimicrobial peptide [Streptomyces sp. NPDC050560]|uniref:MiAMP1 family antimicrobial peptide n=1 Tax=Streptomyces sp. NPDC050560 TaxID=3365630 RepID=UPI00378EDF43
MLKRIATVAAALTALLGIGAGTALASTFVAYEGDHFTGRQQVVRACGVSNITYHGSYKWYSDGQSGRMFNTPNAQGSAVFTLASNRNAEQLTGFGWRSIDIIC